MTAFLAGHPQSYYAATAPAMTDFPVLEGVTDADVAIIGGGFTGINTAIELAERGYNVVLLEAQRIGWGASGRNGGELIRGIGHDLEPMRKLLGQQGIDTLGQMGFEAVDIVKERIQRFKIDCDLQMGYADLAYKTSHIKGLEEELKVLQQLKYPHQIELLTGTDVQQVVNCDRYPAALTDTGSGHLHPLKLVLGEAKAAQALGVRIFENSAAIKIIKGDHPRVQTTHGEVRCKYLVMGGNAYLGHKLEPWLGGKVLPAGTYIIATEPLDESLARELMPGNHAVADMRIALDYYHFSKDNRLLFGGRCNYSGKDPSNIAAVMKHDMLKVFPQLQQVKIEFNWGGFIGIGANRMPQVGQLPDAPNIFFAQAYSGHGVNVTHLTAKLIAEMLTGQAERFDLLAKIPHRTFPGGPALRSPLLALGMAYYRLKELFE